MVITPKTSQNNHGKLSLVECVCTTHCVIIRNENLFYVSRAIQKVATKRWATTSHWLAYEVNWCGGAKERLRPLDLTKCVMSSMVSSKLVSLSGFKSCCWIWRTSEYSTIFTKKQNSPRDDWYRAANLKSFELAFRRSQRESLQQSFKLTSPSNSGWNSLNRQTHYVAWFGKLDLCRRSCSWFSIW